MERICHRDLCHLREVERSKPAVAKVEIEGRLVIKSALICYQVPNFRCSSTVQEKMDQGFGMATQTVVGNVIGVAFPGQISSEERTSHKEPA